MPVILVAIVWILAMALPWQTTRVVRIAIPFRNVTATSSWSRCWVLWDGLCSGKLYSIAAQKIHLQRVYMATFWLMLGGLVCLIPYGLLSWYDKSVWSGLLAVLAAMALSSSVAVFAVGLHDRNRSGAWGNTIVYDLGLPARTERTYLNVGWYLAACDVILLFIVYIFIAIATTKKPGDW